MGSKLIGRFATISLYASKNIKFLEQNVLVGKSMRMKPKPIPKTLLISTNLLTPPIRTRRQTVVIKGGCKCRMNELVPKDNAAAHVK
jgi:hypothetical protein